VNSVAWQQSGLTLGGTVSQSDVGWLTGGDYVLTGGFWSGGFSGASSPGSQQLYLPLVLKNSS
jgi:hypothetical protein